MCHGIVLAVECLANNNNDDNNDLEALVICRANGLPSLLTRFINCDVEARTLAPTPIQIGLPVPITVLGGRLPTFPPFFVPLFFKTRERLNQQEEDGSPAPSPLLMTLIMPTLLFGKDDGTTASASKTPINETSKTAVESEDT